MLLFLAEATSITGQDNKVVERLEYDAWGRRRAPDHKSTPNTLDGVLDNKGFTGHEMLDQLDLVHMNGRVYDPAIGRFLSADAMVADPTSGQNFNRYSYVSNNPTNLTDPSGFCEVVTGSMVCKTGQALVDAVKQVVVYFGGDFVSSGGGKATKGSEGQTNASRRTEAVRENQKVSASAGEPKDRAGQVFSDKLEVGTSGDQLMFRQTGTWTSEASATSRATGCQLICIDQVNGLASPRLHSSGDIVRDAVQNYYSQSAAGVWNASREVFKWWAAAATRAVAASGGVTPVVALSKNVLLEALSNAKPTSGHPNQLMTTLEDGTRVIFRKDFGDNAHPIGGPFQGQGPINHYNIQIQSASGRTIENVHVVPNGSGEFIFWGKDGVIKQ
ncbi:RHS repeat domain-containing protein [Pseudoduganella armeniaca]|uniref:RHS repeat-associated core domain-containing protein n=1 Tax=Pseudoduganella armeniaca TaxID=2072590 RepID=A0A2R4CA03_9BURK|nr:RHS repeat-associated core domain-containing protein [Pseudoduganella armeniaca]AVR96421.1 hypothetical protein C9I28_12455 [Pseudoduganella armeniaca]